jgi:hypothetical protein
MLWYLGNLSAQLAIDFQSSPVPALVIFALVTPVLWFAVLRARRRDERRARARDLVQWRSRPPRY